jgi:hypothetical protein
VRRASKLTTSEDFAIEERREGIRDSRIRRLMTVILSLSFALHLSTSDDDLAHLISSIFRAVSGT